LGEIGLVYEKVEKRGGKTENVYGISLNGFKKAISLLLNLPSYLFYLPSYIHIFNINSMARIDDLEWG
jgi:hypothetical protein